MVLMFAVALLFLMPYLPIQQGIELKIVESGSMEPSIMTGSLVVVRPADSYQIGDVITFTSRYASVPTTHRIIDAYTEGGRTWFVTKGDANEEADGRAVPAQNIVGKVIYDVPRLGYVLDFARQPVGFGFLIVLPALLIILTEIQKICEAVRARRGDDGDREEKEQLPGEGVTEVFSVPIGKREARMIDIGRPVYYAGLPTLDLRYAEPLQSVVTVVPNKVRLLGAVSVLVFALIAASAGTFGTTFSYFNDREVSSDNRFEAIALGFTAVADGEYFSFVDGVLEGDDDGAVIVTVTPEVASADMRFAVEANVTGSTTPLCEKIIGDALSPVSTSSQLALLTVEDVVFDTPWQINLSLSDTVGLVDGEMCAITLAFTSWYFDEILDQGYFDEEEVVLNFAYVSPAPFAPNNLRVGTSALFVSTDLEGEDPVEGEDNEENNAVLPLVEKQSEETVDSSEEGESYPGSENEEEDETHPTDENASDIEETVPTETQQVDDGGEEETKNENEEGQDSETVENDDEEKNDLSETNAGAGADVE